MRSSIGRGDDRPEIHLRQDVLFDIDAGRHFGQREPFVRQFEDAPLHDVKYHLPAFDRIGSAKGAMFDGIDKLAAVAFAAYFDSTVANHDVSFACVEGADDTTFLAA